jgi:hypothetical protein
MRHILRRSVGDFRRSGVLTGENPASDRDRAKMKTIPGDGLRVAGCPDAD